MLVPASASFTRPADTTQYAAGDLVANSTTAGSVTPLSFALSNNAGGTVKVRRVRIGKTDTDLTGASFRAHFYTASPVAANGDNGAYATTQHAAYLGSVDVVVGLSLTTDDVGWGAATIGAEPAARVDASATLYALLEARGTYTPASAEVFTVTIEAEFVAA
jgi:hypothetical protein